MAPPRPRQSSRRSSGGQPQDGRVTKTVSPSATKTSPPATADDSFNLAELDAALPKNSLPRRLISQNSDLRSRQFSYRRSFGGQRFDGRVTNAVSPSATRTGQAAAANDPFNLSQLKAALPNNALPSNLIRCQYCDMVFAKNYYLSKHQFTHAQEVGFDLQTAKKVGAGTDSPVCRLPSGLQQ